MNTYFCKRKLNLFNTNDAYVYYVLKMAVFLLLVTAIAAVQGGSRYVLFL